MADSAFRVSLTHAKGPSLVSRSYITSHEHSDGNYVVVSLDLDSIASVVIFIQNPEDCRNLATALEHAAGVLRQHAAAVEPLTAIASAAVA